MAYRSSQVLTHLREILIVAAMGLGRRRGFSSRQDTNRAANLLTEYA